MEEKSKKSWYKKWWVIVIGVFIVLGVIGVIFAPAEETSKTNTTTDAKKETSSTDSTLTKNAKKGETARDGKFEFVVNKIDCGKTTVGTNEFLQEKAQGQFCLLEIKVTNIGDEAQTLFADNQFLYDDEDRKFSANTTATSYYDSENNVWLEEINPGNSVIGVVVFDVPKDTNIVKAELHDSALSGGIQVDLK